MLEYIFDEHPTLSEETRAEFVQLVKEELDPAVASFVSEILDGELEPKDIGLEDGEREEIRHIAKRLNIDIRL